MAKKRPKTLTIGPAIARAVRGPHRDDQSRWYWQVQIEEAGGRRTLWSGWARKREVQGIAVDLLASDSPPETAKPTETESIRDLLETWTAAQRARHEAGDLSKYGFRNSRNDGRHLVNDLGTISIDRLETAQIEKYRNTRLKAGAASSTVHRELKSLRAAWAWGRAIGITPDRSLPKVAVSVRPAREKHTPSQADIQAVIDAMEVGSWFRWVAEFLSLTGARVREVARLTWDEVDRRNRALSLTGKGKTRTFPISEEISALLDRAPNQGPGHPHGTTVSTVTGHFSSRDLKEACEKAKARRFSSKGFRRAFVDALARAGVDIATAAALTGHSPEVMLKYYRQVNEADKRAAVRTLAKERAKVVPLRKASGQ